MSAPSSAGRLRVLEIGCGNGALLRALDERGDIDFAIGADSSAGMLAQARDTAATAPDCGSSRSTDRRWMFPTTMSTW